ncbi:Acg family FMN-binding oxidoreductase [Streptomyces sp. HK10]|uniref:Acg family FMN-binding oxidoreductase n=1 Tax=Streptomyces sp. HK10 TaxID=3373255 RepID=UPI00374890BA
MTESTPRAGLVRTLVEQAIRAPSSHNTQPWVFRRAADGTVELRADRSRALRVNDPDERELFISCGAALLNLRVAARHHGLAAAVDPLPDPADDALCARVTLSEVRAGGTGDGGTGDDETLYAAIARRHTYRKPFADRPVPEATRHRMRQAVEREGARLSLVPDGMREHVAALVGEGDRRQFADRAWRRELAFWMRPPARGDGLTVPTLAAPVVRTAVRSLDLGARVAARDAALLRTAPLVAVIASRTDERPDWLATGQAWQRALLVLAAGGVLTAYANQPCQAGEPLRTRLAQALPDLSGRPQLLFRAGYPRGGVRPSPRRPVDDVLIR